MRKDDSLLRGAAIISLGTILAKLIGAFYRVPLTRLIGAEGLGIYQLVFPFYCILLTLSSTGIPSALSKIIASGKNSKKVLYKSITAFGGIGFIGSLLMIALSKPLSLVQGNESAYLAYIALSPSVFFVSIISCYRGYFQGKGNMLPTALSQIIEQIVKLAFALTLLSVIPLEPVYQATIACLAVTFSEALALFYVYLKFKNSKVNSEETHSQSIKSILTVVVPVALSACLLPISRVFDSLVIVKLIPLDRAVSIAQYGIYSGGIESLIGVPVAVCYGLAVSGIPLLTKNKNNKKLLSKLLFYTVALSLSAVAVTLLFANNIVNILYGGLNPQQKQLMIDLLKFSAVQIIFLALLQSLNSALLARDCETVPPFSLAIGVGVKIFAVIMLVNNPVFGIFGLAISDTLCYLTAVIINLLFVFCAIKKIKLKGFITNKRIKSD